MEPTEWQSIYLMIQTWNIIQLWHYHTCTKSTSQGLSIAEYMLGKLLIVGADVEQDVLTGIAWLEKAAKRRNSLHYTS